MIPGSPGLQVGHDRHQAVPRPQRPERNLDSRLTTYPRTAPRPVENFVPDAKMAEIVAILNRVLRPPPWERRVQAGHPRALHTLFFCPVRPRRFGVRSTFPPHASVVPGPGPSWSGGRLRRCRIATPDGALAQHRPHAADQLVAPIFMTCPKSPASCPRVPQAKPDCRHSW
jgi:hypothetical protein